MPDLWQDVQSLSAEQKELLLDVTQVALDIGGIFEPTPVCDGLSGLISLYRSDWFGAGVSLVSIVPYLGDTAKFAKLKRYAAVIDKAVGAAGDVVVRRLLAPILAKIVRLCETLPYGKLPPSLRSAVDDVYRAARKGQRTGRAISHIDDLIDRMLVRVFGNADVGLATRSKMRTVVEFFERHHVDGGDLNEWVAKCKGIDFHKPISVQPLRAGDRVATYVEMSKPADRRIGQWLVRERGGVSHRNLGLSDGKGDRHRWVLEATADREVLHSTAAHTVDTWTGMRARQAGVPAYDSRFTGNAFKDGEYVAGGGAQMFLPDAYKYLRKVSGPD